MVNVRLHATKKRIFTHPAQNTLNNPLLVPHLTAILTPCPTTNVLLSLHLGVSQIMESCRTSVDATSSG